MPNLGLSSRAIIGRYYETLEREVSGSWATKLGMKFDSNQESETYKWLGMAPALREWAEGRLAKGLRPNGITIENLTFEATMEVDVDDLRRDKTSQIILRVDEMADRTQQHWEKLLSTLITDGTSGLCYDGQYFFDSDHSEGASGTQLNLLTATQVTPLNVGTAAAPTEAEMASAILGVIGYMMGYLDDVGEPINGGARSWAVMCPTNLWGPALAAATSRLLAAGGAMGDNPLVNTGFNIDVILNPRLTAGSAVFYVFRTDGRVKPFILQSELEPEISAIAEGSEEAFKNNRHLYGVKAIRNVGYGLWQHAAHCTLS